MTFVIDGRKLAGNITNRTRDVVAGLKKTGIEPKLVILIATDDKSAHAYAKMIKKSANKTNIEVDTVLLTAKASSGSIKDTLAKLAADPQIHGIILQTPLPESVDADKLRLLIPVEKDIDGTNPLSAGMLMSGLKAYAPATAMAVLEMLRWHGVLLAGKSAVVIGRSLVVGKPVANLLLNEDATVTICHSRTKDLTNFTKDADVLVVAAGKTHLIDDSHVAGKTVIIDVGTNYIDDRRVFGDVDFDKVRGIVEAISPVPGGVGPVTTAVLLRNVAQAASIVKKPLN